MGPMEQAIKGRELVALDGMWMTYHKPTAPRQGQQVKRSTGARVGLLFLNGLYATRAGNGGAAVGWATTLAERGHPSFRIDLPGFGDSEGEPPPDWFGYINSGGYGTKVSAVIEKIARRYRLPGLVVAGHCAGAVSAIYAAALSRHCLGLVLMDPYFNMQRPDVPKFRQLLNLWSRRSRIGGVLSRMFDQMKQARLTLNGERLPANANLKLLRCWKEVVRGGVPALILRAPSRGSAGLKPRTGEFDYLEHILASAGQPSRVSVEVVEGSNHSFSNQQGRAAIPRLIEKWLGATIFTDTTATFPNAVGENVILMPSAREGKTA